MTKRTATALLSALLVTMAVAAPAVAKPPLRPDLTFGEDGVAAPDFGPRFERTAFTSIRVEPDGSLLTGRHRERSAARTTTYRRYDSQGNLDPSFLPGPEGPSAKAPGDKGKVLRTSGSHTVERVNPDGSSDKTFGKSGRSVSFPFEIEQILPLPSEQIAVAGTIDSGYGERGKGTRSIAIALLDREGDLDLRFGGDGILRLRTEAGITAERLVALTPHGAEGVLAALDQWAAPEGEGQTVIPGGSTIVAFGVNGSPDPSFGNGGTVSSDRSIEALAVLPDGRIVVAGNRWGDRLRPRGVLRSSDIYAARLTPGGQPDPSFGGAGVVIVGFGGLDLTGALLAGADGSVVVGGSSSSLADRKCVDYEGFCREVPVLVRLRSDGSLDPGFGAVRLTELAEPFAVLGGALGVTAIAALPGGGVAVGGGSGIVAFLTRLDPAGEAVRAFGTQGVVTERDRDGRTETTVRGIAVDSRQRILVAGTTNTRTAERGFEIGALFRFLPNGRLDRSFGEDGYVRIPGEPRAVAVGRDDDLFVLSEDSEPNLVAHVSARGRFDRQFGANGVAPLPEPPDLHRHGRRIRMELAPVSLAVTKDGGVIAGGGYGAGELNRGALIRLDRRGQPRAGFGQDGLAIFALGRSGQCDLFQLALRPDGRILLAGRTKVGNHGRRPLLAQVRPDGTLDRTFGHNGVIKVDLPEEGIATSLALRRGGGVLLAGEQGDREFKSRPILLAFDRYGRPDRGFNRRTASTPRHFLPSGRDIAPVAILQSQGRIVTFTAKRRKPMLGFSSRGAFTGSMRFEPGKRKPQRFPVVATLQGSKPVAAAQLGLFGGFVLRRYR